MKEVSNLSGVMGTRLRLVTMDLLGHHPNKCCVISIRYWRQDQGRFDSRYWTHLGILSETWPDTCNEAMEVVLLSGELEEPLRLVSSEAQERLQRGILTGKERKSDTDCWRGHFGRRTDSLMEILRPTCMRMSDTESFVFGKHWHFLLILLCHNRDNVWIWVCKLLFPNS